MKNLGLVFALGLIPLMSQPARGDDMTEPLTKCAQTKDDRQRLSCYDGLLGRLVKQSVPATRSASPYLQIGLADLKADIVQLMGKKIETTGKVQIIGNLDFVMLKTDEFDMAPVMVTAEGLPRDDRKKFLNGCQMILCKVVVSGTIRRHPMGPQLVAEKVVWQ